MKKLLTTIFMAVLTVSVFATVNVETETPSVDHDGACERVGSMRFIVTNDQDYQSASTTTPITVKIELTDGAVLCHDIDGTDDAYNNWVELEVDGVMWQAGEVLARGSAGSNYIEVIIRDNPNDGAGGLPNPAVQAWFRLGSTVLINGAAFNPNLYDDTFASAGSKTQGVPVCVNYTAHPGGVDQFPQNAFNVISLTTWDGGLGGTLLGVSYSPANPAIAYGGTGSTHNFIVDSDCDKYGDLHTYDVKLCKCWDSETVEQVTTYDCYDLYRVGTLDLNGNGCRVFLTEDEAGMLPTSSVITMTIVDASGNPLSTLPATDGVYISSASLTVDGTNGNGLVIANMGQGNDVDLAGGVDEDSNTSYDGYVPTSGTCAENTNLIDHCGVDNYNLYDSWSWSVTTPSNTNPAEINIGDVVMGRYTAAGAITAYVKISWAPFPCGTGNYKVLWDYPLNFIDCPTEETMPDYYFPAYEYFTYFPAVNAQWWAGLAVTNVTYFNATYRFGGLDQMIMPKTSIGSYVWTDQDADVTLYLIEQDGDMYMYDAGVLPKSGINVTLLSDPAFSPTPMTKADTTFGDEPFWVIAEAMPTLPNTFISIDGFGMLGDGNQGQGTLPRVDFLGIMNLIFNK